MKKNIEILFMRAHHSFLEQQTVVHKKYLQTGLNIYQKFLINNSNFLKRRKLFTHRVQTKIDSARILRKVNARLPNAKFVGSKEQKIVHKYLFDPTKERWIHDHCPTFTRPALPMMSIIDILASQCIEYFPQKYLVTIKEVRIFQ